MVVAVVAIAVVMSLVRAGGVVRVLGVGVASARGGGAVWVRVVAVRDRGGLAVNLHVFPQRARVGVALVAAFHLAVVRLVAGVHVAVFLPVRAVGEAPITSVELTLERLLTW